MKKHEDHICPTNVKDKPYCVCYAEGYAKALLDVREGIGGKSQLTAPNQSVYLAFNELGKQKDIKI